MIYQSIDLFAEFLNQNADKMTNDELRTVLDNAPAEIQCDLVWAFWEGFWHGLESAYYRSLPVCSQRRDEAHCRVS